MEFNDVSRPSHYCEGRLFEPIEVINDWQLDFDLGNVVKYISRAGRKDNKIEDLEKALFYLNHAINKEKDKIAKGSSSINTKMYDTYNCGPIAIDTSIPVNYMKYCYEDKNDK